MRVVLDLWPLAVGHLLPLCFAAAGLYYCIRARIDVEQWGALALLLSLGGLLTAVSVEHLPAGVAMRPLAVLPVGALALMRRPAPAPGVFAAVFFAVYSADAAACVARWGLSVDALLALGGAGFADALLLFPALAVAVHVAVISARAYDRRRALSVIRARGPRCSEARN